MSRPFLFACLLLIASAVFIKPDAGLALHPFESASLAVMHDATNPSPNMPLYDAVLHVWTQVTGETVYGIRWLSTALIGLGLAGIVRLCLFIKPAISLSAVIVFGTFTLPYFASAIHPASLIFALSMTAGAVLFMWTESGKKRYLIVYGGLSVLLTASSVYAIWGLALHGVLLLEKYQFKTRRSQIPMLIFALNGLLIAFMPRPAIPLTDQQKWLEWAILLAPMAIFLSAWAVSGASRLTSPAWRQLIPIGLYVIGFLVGIGANTLLFNAH